jgi:hypothetical protein
VETAGRNSGAHVAADLSLDDPASLFERYRECCLAVKVLVVII